MNPLLVGFKECAQLAGEVCSIPNGKLVREFGLDDFVENAVLDNDDAPTIAIKALNYFCEEGNPHAPVFKFAVLAVGVFLNHHHAKRGRQIPQQALADLVTLLKSSPSEDQLRRWIDSNFQ
jgi:hypothetical protein